MALTRPVSVDYWLKQDVNERYSLDDKLLYIYLITNEHTEQLGIYKITFKTISNELNMPIERVEQSMSNLEYKFNIIRYSKKTNEVAILDYLTFGILKGGDVIRKCFDKINKKVQDKSLLAFLYIYTNQFQSDLSMFNEAKERIRNSLAYTDDELSSMNAFQSPIIQYYYDDRGYKYELDYICYDNYYDNKNRTNSVGIVKVKCCDDKYRFINAYCTGEQDIKRKNENTDYIIFIDISKYEQEQQLLVNDEICF